MMSCRVAYYNAVRLPQKPPSLSAAPAASESDADRSAGTENLALEQRTWMFRDKYPIAYEVASAGRGSGKADDDDAEAEAVPILLLNGFGVGSFHQRGLMRQLLLERRRATETQSEEKRQQRYVIYGVDYLGQGKSWPADCDDGNSPDELGLGYSADTRLDQIEGFVDEVVIPSGGAPHLVGNSVGGYRTSPRSWRAAVRIPSRA